MSESFTERRDKLERTRSVAATLGLAVPKYRARLPVGDHDLELEGVSMLTPRALGTPIIEVRFGEHAWPFFVGQPGYAGFYERMRLMDLVMELRRHVIGALDVFLDTDRAGLLGGRLPTEHLEEGNWSIVELWLNELRGARVHARVSTRIGADGAPVLSRRGVVVLGVTWTVPHQYDTDVLCARLAHGAPAAELEACFVRAERYALAAADHDVAARWMSVVDACRRAVVL